MASMFTIFSLRSGRSAPIGSVFGILALALLVGVPTLPSTAWAHLWYPKVCCNDQDCFKATLVEHLPDGSLRIDAGHITVVVPKNFPSLPSLDNDAHVCVFRDMRGRYQPRCVFLPGVG